jgi:hypothetical protein
MEQFLTYIAPTSESKPLVDAFGHLTGFYPRQVAEFSVQIGCLIETTYSLNRRIARSVYESVCNVLVLHSGILDKTLILLRKGAIQKDESVRQISQDAYFVLLKHFSKGYQTPFNNFDHETRCSELLGYIRRLFNHQCILKKEAYSQLVSLAYDCEDLRPGIFNLVSKRFSTFLTRQDECWQIDFEKCFGSRQQVLGIDL